jgi:transposase
VFLNGIFWALQSGAPWRDLPETYRPRTICHNRLVRNWQAPLAYLYPNLCVLDAS